MSQEFEEQQKEKFIEYLTQNAGQEIICREHHQNVEKCDDPIICELMSSSDYEHEKFDIRAQDINDWAWVQEFVPELIIYSAGGQMPFQAEGFIQGLPFYFRTEDGYASLRVSDSKSTLFPPVDALYSSHMDIDNKGLTGSEWVSYLFTLIEKLERTEKQYFFKANVIDYNADGKFGLSVKKDEDLTEWDNEFKNIVGWGNTVDEAFESAKEFISVGLYHTYCHRTKLEKDLNGDYVEVFDERNWSEEKFAYYSELINLQPIVVKVVGDDRNYPAVEPEFLVKVPETWRNDNGTITIPKL